MAQTTGTVGCMRLSDTAGFMNIVNPATGRRETFILWFLPGPGGIPDELNSFTRILHSMWVSLVREAISNNLSVTVHHDDNSSVVRELQLGT